jgi:ABC-type sugar transport system substrate-binding protein
VPAFSILGPWASAFTAEVKQLCRGCSVKEVDVPQTAAIGGQEASIVVAALKQNPSDKYLIFDDGAFAGGINSALSAAGIQGIKIGGGDIGPEQAAELQAGKQTAWTGSNNISVGYADVDMLLRYLTHSPGSALNDVVPTELLTQSNVNVKNDSVFSVPTNALQQFEKLWHIGTTG